MVNKHQVYIVKKECAGHVQNRCGTALRKLKTENGTKKLEDHKTLDGKGHLTNLRMAELTTDWVDTPTSYKVHCTEWSEATNYMFKLGCAHSCRSFHKC